MYPFHIRGCSWCWDVVNQILITHSHLQCQGLKSHSLGSPMLEWHLALTAPSSLLSPSFQPSPVWVSLAPLGLIQGTITRMTRVFSLAFPAPGRMMRDWRMELRRRWKWEERPHGITRSSAPWLTVAQLSSDSTMEIETGLDTKKLK